MTEYNGPVERLAKILVEGGEFTPLSFIEGNEWGVSYHPLREPDQPKARPCGTPAAHLEARVKTARRNVARYQEMSISELNNLAEHHYIAGLDDYECQLDRHKKKLASLVKTMTKASNWQAREAHKPVKTALLQQLQARIDAETPPAKPTKLTAENCRQRCLRDAQMALRDIEQRFEAVSDVGFQARLEAHRSKTALVMELIPELNSLV